MSESIIMSEDQILVEAKVSRNKGEIVYSVDCSAELTNEELEYYLEEIVKGICTWKPSVCQGKVKKMKGKIGAKK